MTNITDLKNYAFAPLDPARQSAAFREALRAVASMAPQDHAPPDDKPKSNSPPPKGRKFAP